MDLFYSFTLINFTIYIKVSFILLLFIINVYLILTHKPEIGNQPVHQRRELQSGFGSKKLKGWLGTLGAFGGFLGSYITIKNEFKDIQIGKLDQLMKEERESIRRNIDKDKEEHQRLLDSIDNNRDELNKLYIEKAKLYGHNGRLLTLHYSIKDKVISFKDKSTDSSVKLSELGLIDQLIKLDTNKFSQEVQSLNLNIENSNNPTTSSSEVEEESTGTPASDLKESSVFNFNIFTFLDWFEDLNGVKKIAISLILGKSVIFSALTSIIFIFYGNILIEKYDLENKYPKLAYIIQLRRKFQKYYFKFNCLLILSIIIIEVVFAIAILLL